MAYLDSTHLEHRPLTLDALMAQLDPERAELGRRPVLEVELDSHLRHVQQMLIAAAMASGAILAVAAVVMVKFL